MIYLAGLSCKEIEEVLDTLPRFRAKQIFSWITRGVGDFEKMTNIPLEMQDELKSKYSVFSGTIDSVHDDKDAKKIVFALKDGSKIESVLLNDGKDRLTACLSTQVGCPVGCVFCKTGSMGFKRNLEPGEIVEQFLLLNSSAYSASLAPLHEIKNMVIMGMGEPLLNTSNLRKALLFFINSLNFSRRRITVSTCGINCGLSELAQNGPYIRLALSLTTADERLRKKLMPITKSNPLSEVKKALALYQKNSGNRITLEIPLLSGINTRGKDADCAAEFAQGLDCVVNIIPWNPVAGLSFKGEPLREPEKREVKDFIAKLESRGLKVTTRLHKGRKVAGACGQLGKTANC